MMKFTIKSLNRTYSHTEWLRLGLLVPACVLLVCIVSGGIRSGGNTTVQQGGLIEAFKKLEAKVERLQETSPPVGTVMAFAGEWPPTKVQSGRWTEEELGWLPCDGRALKSAEYAELYAVIGTTHGGGSVGKDRQTAVAGCDFNLPDYRGLFLRGVDDSSGLDPDAADRVASRPGGAIKNHVGTFQGDALKTHNHTVDDKGHSHSMGPFMGPNLGNGYDSGDRRSAWAWYGAPDRRTSSDKTNISIQHNGGKETRPKNVAVYWIIKVR